MQDRNHETRVLCLVKYSHTRERYQGMNAVNASCMSAMSVVEYVSKHRETRKDILQRCVVTTC